MNEISVGRSRTSVEIGNPKNTQDKSCQNNAPHNDIQIFAHQNARVSAVQVPEYAIKRDVNWPVSDFYAKNTPRKYAGKRVQKRASGNANQKQERQNARLRAVKAPGSASERDFWRAESQKPQISAIFRCPPARMQRRARQNA